MRQDYSHLNTIEDFQKFIDKNNILSSNDFLKRFGGGYNKLKKLKLTKLVNYPNSYNDWSNINTINEFQTFVDENSVLNPRDFSHRFRGLFGKLIRLGLNKAIKYPKSVYYDWSYINTVEDFQKFIDENNIQDCTEMNTKFPGLYTKLSRLGLCKSITYPNQKTDWSNYSRLEHFQEFIDRENIQNATEFENKYLGLYTRLRRLGLNNLVKYPNPHQDVWSYINTVEDFQKFIDENNILCARDFGNKFSGLYHKLCNKKLHSFVTYPNSHMSLGEKIMSDILKNLDISYIYNTIDPVKFQGLMIRPDFRIDSLKIIIEVHGLQHFEDADYFKITAEESIKNDIMKNKIFQEAGYNTLYVVFPETDPHLKRDYSDYFSKIYIGSEEIKSKIIELKNETNSNLLE